MKASVGRVLMLVENNFPADSRVRNEAYSLVEQGVQVSVIALRGPGEPAREVVNGVAVYRVPTLTLFQKLPQASTSKLRRMLRSVKVVAGYASEYFYFTGAALLWSFYVAIREGFDVVHAHNPPDTLFVVGAVHKVFGKKFVFDHHDLSPELYLSRYKKTTHDTVFRTLLLLEKLSLKLADVAIMTNDSYRQTAMARHGIASERLSIVRNGPNLSRVKLVPPDLELRSKGKTILGYVGAMNPQDGLDYLLRALRHLAHDLGRMDFYTVLIGTGDSLDELRAQSKSMGLADHVWFTGYVADEDMLRYLSTADICLDPNPSSPLNNVSTWIKVMEYMALGKPIVSFDLNETRVSAGEAALFVPPNDEFAFAKAVAQLMDDPDRRDRMAECGLARVRERLNWSVSARNLVRAYGRLFPELAQRA